MPSPSNRTFKCKSLDLFWTQDCNIVGLLCTSDDLFTLLQTIKKEQLQTKFIGG